ncbi:hypothetical protein D3C78_1349880 [compost metagenome]
MQRISLFTSVRTHIIEKLCMIAEICEQHSAICFIHMLQLALEIVVDGYKVLCCNMMTYKARENLMILSIRIGAEGILNRIDKCLITSIIVVDQTR